jgi:hypothetical protein
MFFCRELFGQHIATEEIIKALGKEAACSNFLMSDAELAGKFDSVRNKSSRFTAGYYQSFKEPRIATSWICVDFALLDPDWKLVKILLTNCYV